MLLFSTRLSMKPEMGREDFARALLCWNQSHGYEENILPEFTELSSFSGDLLHEGLALRFRELPEEEIAACRYEKRQEDGPVWNTDYVMNFRTHKMAVRLSRSEASGMRVLDPEFSTPRFIATLEEEGLLEEDGPLSVSSKPLEIREENAGILEALVAGERPCRLPVIYVSRTFFDEAPLDCGKLAWRLKGVCHVLVQASAEDNAFLRGILRPESEYSGAAGIYWPSGAHERFPAGESALLSQKVLGEALAHELSPLETFGGVQSRAFLEKAKASEAETSELWDSFGEELELLSERTDEVRRLEGENFRLQALLEQKGGEPLLYQGSETEIFPGEIREIVLESLADARSRVQEDSRRAHVLDDLLEGQRPEGLLEERAAALKAHLDGLDRPDSETVRLLRALGFEIEEGGKHWKICYGGDRRYIFTMAKTPSDWRSQKNLAREICGRVL